MIDKDDEIEIKIIETEIHLVLIFNPQDSKNVQIARSHVIELIQINWINIWK